VAIGAVLLALLFFAFAFSVANGVFFGHEASGTKGGPPGVWKPIEIESIAGRVAGAVLFSAIGLLVLLRTFVWREARSGSRSSRKVNDE